MRDSTPVTGNPATPEEPDVRRVFVSRYSYGHKRLRAEMRRLRDAGQARVVERTRDGWLYELTKEAPRG